MSGFGKTLFGGSPFIRWALSPFLLLFAVVMPLLVDKWTGKSAVALGGLEFFCLALLAGFWLPGRLGRFCFRCLGGGVFVASVAYLIFEFFFSETPLRLVEDRGQPSPRKALTGFVIIGLPSLWYAIFGRFAWRESDREGEALKVEDDAT